MLGEDCGADYTIIFFERRSKKIFLYFSKSKDVYGQTKVLLEVEIPKCRLWHGIIDFIIHSDVGEFQSEKDSRHCTAGWR